MNKKKVSLCSLLAAEDIRIGNYVAVLHNIEQYIPYCLDRLPSSRRIEPISVRLVPEDEAHPLKVLEVCLPFVTARKHDGSLVTLDVRRQELARLDDGYARRIIRRLKAPKPKCSRSRRKE